MKVSIEKLEDQEGCRVWLGEHSVSFRSEEEAEAFVSQLQARITAAHQLEPQARQ